MITDDLTGTSDTTTYHEIMDLLTELNKQGTTIVIVPHDSSVAAQTKGTIYMVDGRIVEAANLGMQVAGINLVNTSTLSRSHLARALISQNLTVGHYVRKAHCEH